MAQAVFVQLQFLTFEGAEWHLLLAHPNLLPS